MTRLFVNLLACALGVATVPPTAAPMDSNSSPAPTSAAETVHAPDASPNASTPTAQEDTNDAADDSIDEDVAPQTAQLAPPDPAEKKALEDRLQALEGAGLSDEDKKKAVDFYQQAIKSIAVAAQQIEAAHGFGQLLLKTREGKYSTAAYAEKLAKPLPPHEPVAGLPLVEIEKRAEAAEASLAHCRQQLAAMIAEPKRRSQRMAEFPGQVAEAQQRLKQATDDLAALGSEDAADLVTAAHCAALTYLRTECKATLYALESEQQLYEQTGDWVTTRRDYYARYVPHKEKRLADLRDIIKSLREREAQEQARLAAAAADLERPKAIRKLADDNKRLADDRAELQSRLDEVKRRLDATRQQVAQLTDEFERARKQADMLSSLGGELLRDQQARLPDARALRRSKVQRDSLRSDVLLHLYDLYDESLEACQPRRGDRRDRGEHRRNQR